MNAPCHEAIGGLCSNAQAIWQHCRGIADKALRRERLPSGELCHDVGVREEEVPHVFLGQSGSQKGSELAFQPLIIEGEGLVIPKGAGLRDVEPQLLMGLDDCIEVGGAERSDRGVSPPESSLCGDDEVQAP